MSHRSFRLDEVITEDDYNAMIKLMNEHDLPHKPLLAYVNSQPHILKNCEKAGLVPSYFAYQFEFIVTSRD